MHTDLSSHLHTEECNALIEQLIKCRGENPFTRFLGACNVQDDLMVMCLKRERLDRRKKNYQKSLELKAHIQGKYREADQENMPQ